MVYRDLELLADLPDGLVRRVVQRREAGAGRRAGEENAAAEPGGLRPLDLLDRAFDVVEHDLRDAGATTRRAVAEVGEPSVVRLQAGPPQLGVARVLRRRLLHERTARVEGRDRVGEDHLGDAAVGL